MCCADPALIAVFVLHLSSSTSFPVKISCSRGFWHSLDEDFSFFRRARLKFTMTGVDEGNAN